MKPGFRFARLEVESFKGDARAKNRPSEPEAHLPHWGQKLGEEYGPERSRTCTARWWVPSVPPDEFDSRRLHLRGFPKWERAVTGPSRNFRWRPEIHPCRSSLADSAASIFGAEVSRISSLGTAAGLTGLRSVSTREYQPNVERGPIWLLAERRPCTVGPGRQHLAKWVVHAPRTGGRPRTI